MSQLHESSTESVSAHFENRRCEYVRSCSLIQYAAVEPDNDRRNALRESLGLLQGIRTRVPAITWTTDTTKIDVLSTDAER